MDHVYASKIYDMAGKSVNDTGSTALITDYPIATFDDDAGTGRKLIVGRFKNLATANNAIIEMVDSNGFTIVNGSAKYFTGRIPLTLF